MKVRFSTLSKKTMFDGAPSDQNLTRDNVYRVIEIDTDDIRIMNDHGDPVLYPLSWFSIVDASWPPDWEVRIGAEGERYVGPKVFREQYFWERYFDGEKEAIQTLKRQLREWGES